VLAHDWLVLKVEPSSEDEDPVSEDVSVELVESVDVVLVPVEATVVDSAPIEPSKATTPHASTNVARIEATTRRRRERTRRARAASLSWAMAEGMP
jgi:hypothetical protein